MNTPSNRREFIKTGAAAGLGLGLAAALPSWLRADPPTGAAGKVRLAVVGTNNRGLDHIQMLAGIDEAEIAYVCDVEDGALAKGMAEVAKAAPDARPKAIKDFRRVLDDKSVDAITIAAPDHWHTPMAILALAAGKHVYVEKPCSQNPHEGELLLGAIARYGRLVQMGNQRRSFPNMQVAVKEIREGVIGKAYYAKAWYDNSRLGIGHGTVVPVPATLDYELWQGPAPRRPYRSNVIPYNWHWFWHWGTGEALNNGTHEVDVCRWALGVDFATRVTSTGGRFQFKDDWETPDTQVIGWELRRREVDIVGGAQLQRLQDRGALARRVHLRHRGDGAPRGGQLHRVRRQEPEGQVLGRGGGGRPDEHDGAPTASGSTGCT